MARRLWFLDFWGKALTPARQKAFCMDIMGIDDPKDPERRLMLERFRWKFGKSMEQCSDFYPPESQAKDIPYLDRRVEGAVRENIGWFGMEEIRTIMEYYEYVDKRNKNRQNES